MKELEALFFLKVAEAAAAGIAFRIYWKNRSRQLGPKCAA